MKMLWPDASATWSPRDRTGAVWRVCTRAELSAIRFDRLLKLGKGFQLLFSGVLEAEGFALLGCTTRVLLVYSSCEGRVP